MQRVIKGQWRGRREELVDADIRELSNALLQAFFLSFINPNETGKVSFSRPLMPRLAVESGYAPDSTLTGQKVRFSAVGHG